MTNGVTLIPFVETLSPCHQPLRHLSSIQSQINNRKSKIPGSADLQHYQKIIVALHVTIRLMAAIDHSIASHGGCKDVFL